MSKIIEDPSHVDHIRQMQIRASQLRLIQGHIEPFTETPSAKEEDCIGRIGSHELFSLFTAEIIRQNVIFTR